MSDLELGERLLTTLLFHPAGTWPGENEQDTPQRDPRWVDWGGPSFLLRFEHVSLNPRTRNIAHSFVWSRSREQKWVCSRRCPTGPGARSGCSPWSHSMAGPGRGWDVDPCKDVGRLLGTVPGARGLVFISRPWARGDRDAEPWLVGSFGEGAQS